MKQRIMLLGLCTFMCASYVFPENKVYHASSFGILPGENGNVSAAVQRMISTIRAESAGDDNVTIVFGEGAYHFHEEGATERTYYISNHDQTNPKKVGIDLEGMQHVTVDGKGADFIFHGRMLPVALTNSRHCTLTNFSIDFETPHISQVRIVENTADGIVFAPEKWVNFRIDPEKGFEAYGENWTNYPLTGIAFEKDTKRIVYRTSDLSVNLKDVTLKDGDSRLCHAPHWKDERLKPGTVVALRDYQRPAPGIFLSHNLDTKLLNVTVHFAEGMGLLAQLCEDITLNRFNVCLRGTDDPRYFTTQADATHFSSCKGKITSTNGLYENMMDDAINVHGTYLKVLKRIDANTLIACYMHGQAWGFDWGMPGDEVQFIRSQTMEIVGSPNRIASIRPHGQEEIQGVKDFLITFAEPIDTAVSEKSGFGIENLTWTPEVYFAKNVVCNNRARGALFSTPQKTVAEDNVFDHTSGTAILLCGDCNGWFETGACRDVTIRRNHFINALTNMFQFTNAVISIYPEIPDLKGQEKYFHGGKPGSIRIEDNVFETFDRPILYAKSTDGITFVKNRITQNNDYPAFHQNTYRFLFERVRHVEIKDNTFSDGFDAERDVKYIDPR